MIAASIGMKKPWINGMEYYIDQFYVKTDWQGKGTGSLFLKLIESEIRTEKMNAIILNTEKGSPAENFYLKNGFRSNEELIILSSFIYCDQEKRNEQPDPQDRPARPIKTTQTTNFLVRIQVWIFWCGLPDLNRYGLPHAPQTCASAYSAKAAYEALLLINNALLLYKFLQLLSTPFCNMRIVFCLFKTIKIPAPSF